MEILNVKKISNISAELYWKQSTSVFTHHQTT